MDTSHSNATIEEDWIMNEPVKEQNHQNINDEILRTRNEKTLNDNTKTSYNNHNSPIKHYYSGTPSNPLDHSQEKLVTDLQKIIHDQNEMIKNLNLTIKNLTLRIDELDKKLSHDDINTCATEKKKFDQNLTSLPTQRKNQTYPNGNENTRKSIANISRKDKGNIDPHIATINKVANSYIK
ncbi:hypothetical protein GJ496_007427 [Pomphorhynchus laevis]|nr:hypothetical protein GJ496_007427 [Pomphorhynchus laevis]